MIDAKRDTTFTIGQEFVVGEFNKKEVPQRYTLVGMRGDQVFLIAEGQKDGSSHKVIAEDAEAMLKGRIQRREIVTSITPEEKIRALSIATELVREVGVDYGAFAQIGVKRLKPGNGYEIRGRMIEGGQFKVSGQFIERGREDLLIFDTGLRNKDGLVPVVTTIRGVDLLDVSDGKLSLPVRLVNPSTPETKPFGVSLWRPLHAS